MPRRIVVAVAATIAAATIASPAAAASPAQDPTVVPPPAVTAPAKPGSQSPGITAPTGRRMFGPRITDSLRVARAFWETQPHGCQTVRVYDAVLPDEFGGITIPAVPCTMWIGHGLFTGHHADDRVATCDQIVRQYGALVGARRSLHPRAIMNPATSATVWGCNHRFAARRASDAAPPVWATR